MKLQLTQHVRVGREVVGSLVHLAGASTLVDVAENVLWDWLFVLIHLNLPADEACSVH